MKEGFGALAVRYAKICNVPIKSVISFKSMGRMLNVNCAVF